MIHEEIWSGTRFLDPARNFPRQESMELRCEPPDDAATTQLSADKPVFRDWILWKTIWFLFMRRDEKAGGQRQSPAAPPWERGDAAGPVDDGFLRGIEGICYAIKSRRLRAKMLQAAAPIMPSSPADGSGAVVAATHALPVWHGFVGVGLEIPFT